MFGWKMVKMNPNHQHRAHTYELAEEKPKHMNKRENPWRCKCRWWGRVVNLDREQRRGLQLPAYKSPENCRNPGNDPNPNSLSFTWLGSGRVQSRQKFKQDSDDNSGGNERSEPVWRETDDIDSFFGGKPLARCPIGAPTLHTTISWIITQLTPGPPTIKDFCKTWSLESRRGDV